MGQSHGDTDLLASDNHDIDTRDGEFDKLQTTIVSDGITLNDEQIKILNDYLKKGNYVELKSDNVL